MMLQVRMWTTQDRHNLAGKIGGCLGFFSLRENRAGVPPVPPSIHPKPQPELSGWGLFVAVFC